MTYRDREPREWELKLDGGIFLFFSDKMAYLWDEDLHCTFFCCITAVWCGRGFRIVDILVIRNATLTWTHNDMYRDVLRS